MAAEVPQLGRRDKDPPGRYLVLAALVALTLASASFWGITHCLSWMSTETEDLWSAASSTDSLLLNADMGTSNASEDALPLTMNATLEENTSLGPHVRTKRSVVQDFAADRGLSAYDCTVPLGPLALPAQRDLACPEDTAPTAEDDFLDGAEPQKHLLLQEVEQYELKAYVCRVETTRVSYQCSHGKMVRIPDRTHYDLPSPVTKTQCRQMVETQQLTLLGKTFHVYRGRVVHARTLRDRAASAARCASP